MKTLLTTILIVLMIVTITTPCLTQEIEPEGLFGIHGTVWRKIGVEKLSEKTFGIDRGFYDGRVYGLKTTTTWGQLCYHSKDYYHDFLAISFYKYEISVGTSGADEWTIVEEGILFPLIGIGFVKESEYYLYCDRSECHGGWWSDPYYFLLIKVNNWWDFSQDCPNFE